MAVTNGYTTLALVRTALGNFAVGDTTDDARIEASIEAASRQIDGWCSRRFWVDGTVVDRQYRAESGRCIVTDDISTVTGLVVKIDEDADGTFETTLTITTDFILEPLNAADRVPVWPYTEIVLVDNYTFPIYSTGRPGVQVTAKFGWPAVPDDVEQACLDLAIDHYKSKDAAGGLVGSPEFGMMRLPKMNPTAKALLAPYRKPAVA